MQTVTPATINKQPEAIQEAARRYQVSRDRLEICNRQIARTRQYLAKPANAVYPTAQWTDNAWLTARLAALTTEAQQHEADLKTLARDLKKQGITLEGDFYSHVTGRNRPAQGAYSWQR